MFLLSDDVIFPPVHLADADGVLAFGGDLSVDRLLLAYRSGIFPWYNDDEPIIWWSTDPRFVLLPGKLKVTKSMQTVLNNGKFRFTINRAFKEVIQHCKATPRPGQAGTWISKAVQEAYTKLHEQGHAISAETWENGKLVGGLYGVLIGRVFFGESMFSHVSNASKFAFINCVRQLQKQNNLALIDCQVYTAHLESLGAEMIPREKFIELLDQHTVNQ